MSSNGILGSGYNSSWLPVGGAIGALGGMFGTDKPSFHNPADAANPWMDKIPDELKQYLMPYINQGQNAYAGLNNTYSSMMNDPSGVLSKIGAGYKESPGYQFALKQAMLAGNNSAAAGGMLGSPQNQYMNAETAQGLASKDYDTYLNHALDVFGGGMKGQQGFYDTGFKASGDISEMLSQALMKRAEYASRGAESQNNYEAGRQKQQADMWGGIGGAASLLGYLF